MIVDCAQYHHGVRKAEVATVTQAARLMREGPGFVWLVLGEPTAPELQEVGAAFDLSTLATAQATQGHPRPKLEEYGDSAFVVVKTVGADETAARLTPGELDVFLGPRYAVVVSRAASQVISGARQRIDEHPETTQHGPMAALWAVLDSVIDDGERIADLLIDEAERIEQAVFEGDRDQSQLIYEHQRRVERLARVIHPVLAIFDTLDRGERVAAPDGVRPLLRDAGDHARRLSEEVEMLSGRLDGLLNANLARVTVRQNVIVQKVSAWAAIAAAPTIITGIYGMNFRRFPELSWTFGYPLAIGVMIVAVLVLRWNFRRAGWL